ncbi:MAG: hypothetical protein IPK59_12030 [Rhodospirillaceae bacterium]|nr:hypothetical protein [Rhodospirillaceae bacterium]
MEQNRNKREESGPSGTNRRRCLICGQRFRALGPFLRICGPCKESEEWQAGAADFTLHAGSAANDN